MSRVKEPVAANAIVPSSGSAVKEINKACVLIKLKTVLTGAWWVSEAGQT